jgi:hypothetical protein
MKFLILLLLLLAQSVFAQTANSDNLGAFITDVLSDMQTPGRIDCADAAPISSIKDVNGESIAVSELTEEQALKYFRELANDPKIPFAYPDDGCYARAHYMSRKLEEKGIITDKVFLEGNLRVETANSPTGSVTWWYHVAPVVMVKKDGKEVLMVFDPSIFDRPVPVEDWVKIQTKHDGGRVDRVYNTRRFVYQPATDARDKNWRPEDISDMKRTMQDYLPVARERIRAREDAERAARILAGRKP